MIGVGEWAIDDIGQEALREVRNIFLFSFEIIKKQLFQIL